MNLFTLKTYPQKSVHVWLPLYILAFELWKEYIYIYISLIEDFYLREMFRQKRYQNKIRIGLQPEKKKKKKKDA